MSEVTSNIINERDRRIDEAVALYLREAQDGKPPSREEFLHRYPDLTPELEDFLQDEAQFENVAAPLQAVGQAIALPPDGAHIGDYTLLELIAQGGMGVVYRAQQRSLGRVVALKVLRAGRLADATERQRFRLEAEAVAHLDHPGIVPVYDVGEHEGWLYFSMKFVDGGSLAAYMDHVGWPDKLRSRQEMSARRAALLDLMIQVCDAVHYAHQHGVLHRDLKPGNILLDRQRRPHVSDFGLAKFVHGLAGPDATVPGRLSGPLTEAGAILGTPSYMAPEQASGHPDAVAVTADVYSLGAIMYELLTGRPPFREATPLATVRALMEREPVRPRSLRPSIDRDLQTICLKCLEKKPARRYETPRDLGEELRRCLRGEPIQARPISMLERSARWAGRHPARASAAGLGFMAIAGAIFGPWFHAHRMQLAAEEKEHARVKAQKHADAGDELANRTLETLERMMQEASGTDPARSEVLQHTLNYYQKLISIESDARVERGLALVQLGKARVLATIGSTREALRAFDEAFALYRAMLAGNPADRTILAQLAAIHQSIGTLQHRLGRMDAARVSNSEARRLLEALLQDAPDDTGLLDNLAIVLANEAQRAYEVGRDDLALERYEQAEARRQRLVELVPGDPHHCNNLAGIYAAKAKVLERERHDDAIRAYDKALKLRVKLVDAHERVERFRRDLGDTYGNCGNFYLASGHPKDALNYQGHAHELQSALVQANPSVAQYRRDLAATHRGLGATMTALTRYAGADVNIKQAEALETKLIESDADVLGYRLDLARTWACAGNLYAAWKKPAEAVKSYQRARVLYEDLLPTDPDNVIYRRELADTQQRCSQVQARSGAENEAVTLPRLADNAAPPAQATGGR
jgi:serine/threonine protein kinase/tetratricopeptide (TPR) repeat protein